MAVNVLFILFIANNLALLYASNIGYVFSHVLALTGFLLLRMDRPDWPRPIKAGGLWPVVAGLLALFNLVLVVWGVTQRELASTIGGYDFSGSFFVGFAVLILSVLLFFYRRVVQDKARITLRDTDVSITPSEEQMALLREEVSAR
jgi:amino acid transporter